MAVVLARRVGKDRLLPEQRTVVVARRVGAVSGGQGGLALTEEAAVAAGEAHAGDRAVGLAGGEVVNKRDNAVFQVCFALGGVKAAALQALAVVKHLGHAAAHEVGLRRGEQGVRVAAQGGVVQQNAAVEAFRQLPALIRRAAVLAVGVGLPQEGHTVESVKYLRYSVGYNVVFLDRLDLTGGLAGEFDFGVTMDGHGKVPPLGFTKCFLPVPCAAAW